MTLILDALFILGNGPAAEETQAAAELRARDLVRKGLPAASIETLAQQFEVRVRDIQRILGVTKSTKTRKRAAGDAQILLRRGPSDVAFRMATVFSLAMRVFEAADTARAWFREPNRALHGERPFDLLDTWVGTSQVVRVLHRLEHGIYP